MPGDIFVSEDGLRIRILNGTNNNGFRQQRGVYYFSEQIKGQNCKYILLQDTLIVRPLVRGVVYEDGIITSTTGLGRGRLNSKRIERFIEDFMTGFLKCERYLTVAVEERKYER